jgi:hypothetical protein
MARPRIFISSTYYDLKVIRDDLDRFIKQMGYEPIRHEASHLAYGVHQPLEAYAYKEIELCDILVCLIGGRYGTQSGFNKQSITQNELSQAIEKGKQLYIFIEEAVLSEYDFYKQNKDNSTVKYTHADSIDVYKFIETLYSLPYSNPIFPFKMSSDIITILTEQWAGLFQRLLSENENKKQGELIHSLNSSVKTIEELIKYINEKEGEENPSIDNIIFYNHPLFHKLSSIMGIKGNFYFKSIGELDELLLSTRFYKRVDDKAYPGYYSYRKIIYSKTQNKNDYIIISKDIFDENGEIIPSTKLPFRNDMVKRFEIEIDENDDEIPF